jgi:hypothetical protein
MAEAHLELGLEKKTGNLLDLAANDPLLGTVAR